MKKTRKEKRDERADAVCREVRYQLANNPDVDGPGRLFVLVERWMRYANKSKYERPIIYKKRSNGKV